MSSPVPVVPPPPRSSAVPSAVPSHRGTTVLVVLALLAALLGVDLARLEPAAAEGAGTRGKVAGFGITTSSGGVRAVTLEADRIAATGGNTVSLEATWEVERQDSNEVRRTDRTVSDEELLIAARRAREAGLNVMMTVKTTCTTCDYHTRWRGVAAPSDRRAFFTSYRRMTNHYAALAEQAGAVLFFVGSEMNTLQGETAAWRRIVLEARQRFGGNIGYQANWDALTGIGFWDEVDIAGVSAYFPLSDELAPNISDLMAAWSDSDTEAHRGSDWAAQVEAFARSHRKPVLFGEIGYQSAVQAAQRPFVQDKVAGYDGQLQSDLYQTVLTLFEDKPWWLGVIWWEYKITSADEGDYDYSPRGKLAEQLLTRWYSGQRPAARERSLVGTSRPSAKADGKPRPTGPAKPPTSGPGATAPRPPAPKPAPVAAPAAAAPSTTATATLPPAASAAPLPTDVQAATELPPVRVAPELPSALADVEVQTVDQALTRAAEREERERATVIAGGLLAPLLLGHAFGLYRRLRRPDIFLRGPAQGPA